MVALDQMAPEKRIPVVIKNASFKKFLYLQKFTCNEQ
jgi:hypothetical protein